ncbi:MAG TPA: uroporphyrinogen decarboxylase family protein [Methanomassiliicoccales archaeon]|nr:uroporphyrinogen decarboxylase family protein [Methanomassiliicoccales archaeon]
MFTERERIHAALDLQPMDRPAVTGFGIITVEAIMGTGINPATMFQSGKDMANLGKYVHDKLGFEDLNLFLIWTHLEAMGATINYNVPIPYCQKSPLEFGGEYTMPDMDKYLKDPNVIRSLEGFKYARQLAGKDGAVTGVTSWGPLTTAGHLVGTENLMLNIAIEPEEVHRLLKFVAEYDAQAYKLEMEAGINDADVFGPGEPTASGDLVSPDMFAEFSLPYVQKEIKAIRSTGTRVQLHICGDTTEQLYLMAQSGANSLSVEEKVDPFEAMKRVQGKVAMVGSVGPIKPLMMGTEEEVVEATKRYIDAGYRMIQPGCAIPPEVSSKNLIAMTSTVKNYKKN